MGTKWIFEKSSPMGGMTGSAVTNILRDESPYVLLSREALQNSLDAADRDLNTKVRVVIRQKALTGTEKDNLIKTLSIDKCIKARDKTFHLHSDNCLKAINDNSKPLKLLYIEDWNTIGLEGDPHHPDSHFHRLLLSIGDDTKAFSAASSGGSHGYGKTVYSSNSRIFTIFAYSTFANNGGGANESCLMGCAFFGKHHFKDQNFTGRAWFGVSDEDEPDKKVHPFKGDVAHKLAEKLGFTSRKNGDKGTTILIVDCPIELDELKKNIETWWWPCLADDKIDIEIYDNDEPVAPPRPKTRDDLKPFLECFDLALGRSQPIDAHQKMFKFQPMEQYKLGSLGFQVLDLDLADMEEVRELTNKVALIRELRMVVEYQEFSKGAPEAVGVFVADNDVDADLRLSEPPNHKKWEATSERLGQGRPGAQIRVKKILNRIRYHFQRFQRETQPPQPKTQRRVKLLERTLGMMLRPKSADRPNVPSPESAPIRIHFTRAPAPEQRDGKLVTTAAFKVKLKDDFEEDSIPVKLQIYVPILQDSNAVNGDPLPFTLNSSIEKLSGNYSVKVSKDFTLNKTDGASFEIESAPYDPSWSTKVIVNVVRN